MDPNGTGPVKTPSKVDIRLVPTPFLFLVILEVVNHPFSSLVLFGKLTSSTWLWSKIGAPNGTLVNGKDQTLRSNSWWLHFDPYPSGTSKP